ncbi:hypothetical protein QYE76_034781 [Lolium multiflorum]|uniref:Uncharacterized protein n=1 Tax=Lolium multiflorum TaxID=4521 RepID=A0AAD8QY04_LOLMU|nr:hypothetical protein QYE76_034781 [Lolium multiflorum]
MYPSNGSRPLDSNGQSWMAVPRSFRSFRWWLDPRQTLFCRGWWHDQQGVFLSRVVPPPRDKRGWYKRLVVAAEPRTRDTTGGQTQTKRQSARPAPPPPLLAPAPPSRRFAVLAALASRLSAASSASPPRPSPLRRAAFRLRAVFLASTTSMRRRASGRRLAKVALCTEDFFENIIRDGPEADGSGAGEDRGSGDKEADGSGAGEDRGSGDGEAEDFGDGEADGSGDGEADGSGNDEASEDKLEKRGPAKRLGKKDHFNIEAISPEGQPVAPASVRVTFKNQCGVVVRDHIPITVREWNKTKNVSEDQVADRYKNTLFDDLMSHFTLPNLGSDSENAKQRALVKKWALKKMGELFRAYKNRLWKAYKAEKKPPLFENYLAKQEHNWEEFVKYKESEEAVNLSKKNKKNASEKKYHHHTGRGGYDDEDIPTSLLPPSLANEDEPAVKLKSNEVRIGPITRARIKRRHASHEERAAGREDGHKKAVKLDMELDMKISHGRAREEREECAREKKKSRRSRTGDAPDRPPGSVGDRS